MDFKSGARRPNGQSGYQEIKVQDTRHQDIRKGQWLKDY
jgi:hypothetical protein